MKKTLFLSLLTLCAVTFASSIPAPWGGALDLKGNSKFICRGAVLPLVKGKSYRFDFKITKLPPMSTKKIEHRLILYSVNGNKHQEIKSFAAEVPVDGKTYQVASAFTVPANANGELKLFVYNCNAKGTLKLADFKISELAPAEKINTNVTEIKAVAVNTPAADSNEIRPAFGNREKGILEGNGRFLYRTEVLPLQPGHLYNITFEMCKIAPLSKKNIEHRIVFAQNPPSGGYREFAYFGENVPVDGKWHNVKGSFTAPKDGGKYSMFVYNCNADGSMEIKNVCITAVNKSAATVSSSVTAPKPAAPAASAIKKAPDFEVAGNGKFKGGHFHVAVKPASVCEFNFKMMKTPKMSANTAEQRVVIAAINTKGAIREIGYIGEKIPADSKWHNLKYSLKIPSDCNGTLRIYVYNCNATGKIALKDFTYQCK